jgi:hypothetical protein
MVIALAADLGRQCGFYVWGRRLPSSVPPVGLEWLEGRGTGTGKTHLAIGAHMILSRATRSCFAILVCTARTAQRQEIKPANKSASRHTCQRGTPGPGNRRASATDCRLSWSLQP